ncbi:MAG TPA: SDR family NAD(P)-dependent oxidoreductase, partial [Caldimonas sp.]|nr:SDR family NAD(P)-dependent oxidoreductase [Caldimonas sp.]
MTLGRTLEGKGALVTGAGTGIGRAIALTYARAGATLVLNGRRAEPLEAVRREIEADGGKAHVVAADVS